MKAKYSLKELFTTWMEQRSEELAKDPHRYGEHLSPEELFELTRPGGLATAERRVMEHLASCPWCLEKWHLMKEIFESRPLKEISGELDRSPVLEEYVLLEAASTEEAGSEIVCRTSDERITLTLYPGDDRNPEKVYLALRIEDEELREKVKDRVVTISFYDKTRRKIMETKGLLQEGKLVKILDLREDLDNRIKDISLVGIKA